MREVYAKQLSIAVGILILIATATFAFLQCPELLDYQKTAAVEAAAAIPHPVEGHQQCSSCHGPKGTNPYPLKHTGWSDASCPKCHTPSR